LEDKKSILNTSIHKGQFGTTYIQNIHIN
jgi:hypothetical protein